MAVTRVILTVLLALLAVAPAGRAATYYVSSSAGDDGNTGLTPAQPFASVAKVNALSLAPGDAVLFRCGDTWAAQPLVVTAQGSAAAPVTFDSYPADCTDRPVLSGSLPVAGWVAQGGGVYVADLGAGANAGRFPHGLNQLFRDGGRLPCGRWPNPGQGDAGGYSLVVGQPAASLLQDAALPAGDWTGASLHLRTMTWLLVNRLVTASGPGSLTLGSPVSCYTGSCAGWGYFLNNHKNALDLDGEWAFEAATNRVYLYSTAGPPSGIEGSAVLDATDAYNGGIVLGRFTPGGSPRYVTIRNFLIENWYADGITTPVNLFDTHSVGLVLENNEVRNVDRAGIRLATWVYDADQGGDGWRGGENLRLSGNVIDGANQFGLTSYAHDSLIENNVIRNVGLMANLGAAGMGCGFTGDNCTENGDGLRLTVDDPDFSGSGNTVRGNTVEDTGYCGLDVFGPGNAVTENSVRRACVTKSDCGGLRAFGGSSLATTNLHDLTIRRNVIADSLAVIDGCHQDYRWRLGFGLYIDHNSRDVASEDNVISGCAASGLLYAASTGTITGNVLYGNGAGLDWSSQVSLGGDAAVQEFSGNVLCALKPDGFTLDADRQALAVSDRNVFFNPYRARNIRVDGEKTLPEWQAASGLDAQATAAWFSQAPGESPRAKLFVNPTPETATVPFGTRRWLDLDQAPMPGPLVLAPYAGTVLVADGGRAPFAPLWLLLEP